MRLFVSKRVLFILIGIIWFELTVLPIFSVGTVKPNLFFIFLVFYAFHIDYYHLVGLALFFGLAKDIFTNSFFGLETASYVSSAALLQYAVMRLDREKKWIQWSSLFVFSFTNLLIFSFLALFVQRKYGLSLPVLGQAFFVSFYTTLLGAVLFPFFGRWAVAGYKSKQYELFK